ncbi:MAG: bifunctional diaminohydroxyphosphoribosylaminopyrimidine deaminase/5-amino-6-(5-phosphoribosylamino)uracil reductase RibD [Rhodospirillales bacterium]
MATSDQPASHTDRQYMRAALALAARGLGNVAPNPAVGCLIVSRGRIAGRGFTQPGGRPHAETVALDQAGSEARQATVYVTLEPCSHHGQTPPCADALIAAGVSRVVIALEDPDPRVAGQGIKRLTDAGIRVQTGICRDAATRLNAGYLGVRAGHRPGVTLKLAMTLDGRLATSTGRSKWITGEMARRYGHLMRAQHDAIAVGIGTAGADTPSLTCRLPGLEHRSPLRVVFDTRLKLDPASALADTSLHQTLVLTAETRESAPARVLSERGVKIVTVETDRDGRPAVDAALRALADHGITRLLVEGGAGLATAFLQADCVDELAIFTAPALFGSDGLAAIGQLGLDDPGSSTRFRQSQSRLLGPDRLDIYHC